MKKKNRTVSILLAAFMLLTLASCGSSTDEETESPSSVSADSSVEESSNTEETASSAEDDTESSESTAAESTEASTTDEVTLDEAEIFNNGEVTVTVTGIETDSFWGQDISLTVYNGSSSNIIVSTDYLSVNGFSLSLSSAYIEVAAGMSAIDSITLYDSELEPCGIDTVTEVSFYLKLRDSDSYSVLETSDLITLTTSASTYYEQAVDDSGDVIYDSNGIRIICKGLQDDSIWDGELVFFVENSSGQSITVYADNEAVNNIMADTIFSVTLRDSTKAIDGMTLYNLDEIGIESIDDVQTISFTLRIVDADSWSTIDESDTITLTFS